MRKEKDLVIVGHGGMGREASTIVNRVNQRERKWKFLGYIAQKKEEQVIGDDAWLLTRTQPIDVIIAVGSSELRRMLTERYSDNKAICFPNLIDPSVLFCDELIQMGQGNIICAGSIFTTNIQMGDFNIVNLGCTVSHDVRMGNFVTVSSGCNLSGNVTIGNQTEIGAGTQMIQGTCVGDRAVIGAGAVIISDLADDVTAVGVPAKIIKTRRA